MEELWSLLNLVTNRGFNDKAFFIDYFADPIKRLIAKRASFEAVERGNQRTEELRALLGKYLLQRKKEDVLADRLKGKREIVVFCELSDLQKRIYLHLLSLPDFCNVKMGATKCPCGSGRKRYFIRFIETVVFTTKLGRTAVLSIAIPLILGLRFGGNSILMVSPAIAVESGVPIAASSPA